jgi:3-oxoacyl-[acyl-carrier protein] reductase
MLLQNRVAIITGAGRGIGRAIAIQLAQEGADLALFSFTAANVGSAAAEVQEKTGRRVIAVQGDVASAGDVQRLFDETMQAFGRVDILINNAGITRDNLLMRMSEGDWDTVLDSNLKGAFLCTKAASRIMLKQKSGRIINITSVIGIAGNAGQANYAASKGGLIALTKSTAKELGSRGITVNAIAPGYIITSMTDALPEEIRDEMKKRIPLGRLGQPEDIAKVALFLSSDYASYMTGQVVTVDGGMFM